MKRAMLSRMGDDLVLEYLRDRHEFMQTSANVYSSATCRGVKAAYDIAEGAHMDPDARDIRPGDVVNAVRARAEFLRNMGRELPHHSYVHGMPPHLIAEMHELERAFEHAQDAIMVDTMINSGVWSAEKFIELAIGVTSWSLTKLFIHAALVSPIGDEMQLSELGHLATGKADVLEDENWSDDRVQRFREIADAVKVKLSR